MGFNLGTISNILSIGSSIADITGLANSIDISSITSSLGINADSFISQATAGLGIDFNNLGNVAKDWGIDPDGILKTIEGQVGITLR